MKTQKFQIFWHYGAQNLKKKPRFKKKKNFKSLKKKIAYLHLEPPATSGPGNLSKGPMVNTPLKKRTKRDFCSFLFENSQCTFYLAFLYQLESLPQQQSNIVSRTGNDALPLATISEEIINPALTMEDSVLNIGHPLEVCVCRNTQYPFLFLI